MVFGLCATFFMGFVLGAFNGSEEGEGSRSPVGKETGLSVQPNPDGAGFKLPFHQIDLKHIGAEGAGSPVVSVGDFRGQAGFEITQAFQ